MDYFVVGLISFGAGCTVTWLYKSAVAAKMAAELATLKASAAKAIGKV